MKNVLKYFFMTLILSNTVKAQQGGTQWELKHGGQNFDAANAITFDKNGDMYVTGYFQGEATFADKKISSNGDTDFYLAKYNKKGKLLWITSAGSDYNRPNEVSEFGTSLAEDGRGNVFLVGSFKRTIDFGKAKLVSSGKDDIFISKYSKAGDLIWARKAGGRSQDYASAVAVDDKGNLYLTGYYQNTAQFNDVTVSSDQFKNFFLAKYDGEGNLKWIKSYDQKGQAEGTSLVFFQDKIFVGGNFETEVSIGTNKITARGNQDIFIAGFSKDGKSLMLVQTGDQEVEALNDMDVNEDGIFVTGWREGASDGRTLLLAKYSLGGEHSWSRKLKGTGVSEGTSVKIIQRDQIVLGGYYQNEITFNDVKYPGAGVQNPLLVQFNNGGEFTSLMEQVTDNTKNIRDISYSEGSVVIAGKSSQKDEAVGKVNGSDKKSEALIQLIDIQLNKEKVEVEESSELSVYPNPSRGAFTVSLEVAKETERELKVTDITGKIVHEQRISAGTRVLQVALPTASKGVYNIQIIEDEIVLFKKIILY